MVSSWPSGFYQPVGCIQVFNPNSTPYFFPVEKQGEAKNIRGE
jgi:hypothetical protein